MRKHVKVDVDTAESADTAGVEHNDPKMFGLDPMKESVRAPSEKSRKVIQHQ